MSNFQIWQMSYTYGWATLQQVQQAVITQSNPQGEITIAEYEEITGQAYPEPITVAPTPVKEIPVASTPAPTKEIPGQPTKSLLD